MNKKLVNMIIVLIEMRDCTARGRAAVDPENKRFELPCVKKNQEEGRR